MSLSTVPSQESSVTDSSAAQRGSFRLYRHVVIALAVALIAPLTVLAWPFAILVGIVIGQDTIERSRGGRPSAAVTILRVLAVTGGVLGMLFFGAILGGLLAFLIVALSALGERAAADADSVDRIVARLLLFVVPILGFVALIALGAQVDIRFGA
jgi:hypothetical protein